MVVDVALVVSGDVKIAVVAVAPESFFNVAKDSVILIGVVDAVVGIFDVSCVAIAPPEAWDYAPGLRLDVRIQVASLILL